MGGTCVMSSVTTTTYLVLLTILLYSSPALTQDYPCDRSSTPRTIENDFLTNCSSLGFNYSGVCRTAWIAFSGAFSGRNPSTISPSDYQPYFDILPVQTAANQSLFWSGTFQLVNIISMMNSAGAELSSSTNTYASEIVNNLGLDVGWCGIEGGGIDYDNPCSCTVTNAFWEQFSLLFSRAARGVVFFLGDGERNGGTFRSTSIFSRIELPNLNISTVTKVVALAVHREGQGESCLDASSSLTNLRDQVNQKSLTYDCYDIIGNINSTDAIADCTARVVRTIQLGMETTNRKIDCTSGVDHIMGSLMIMFCCMLATFLNLNYID